ncbi:hypothetical protein ACFFUT_18835 [Pseudohalocynthiibacter aestuariivivens]|uniref:Uncharacterized protein n=1 Tax=Pseudohalocynthiibacter aestuariivivens TaxID=1591409 RepID=A0ABV5JK76_9RHOB|nr:hypothetical protein [Pseudohalocynthiibacter aestuariivivens]MBS9715576.1 hypothetical protein [Pseudohalocynthiibacter aestuariivivens]
MTKKNDKLAQSKDSTDIVAPYARISCREDVASPAMSIATPISSPYVPGSRQGPRQSYPRL